MQRRFKLYGVFAAIALVLDQITKIWARAALEPNEPTTVINNFFDWKLSFNGGSAFSMFEGQAGARILLTIVAFIALGAITWMVWKSEGVRTRLIASYGIVAGGALGNLIDRIAYGEVTDFVAWHYYDYTWPIFNIADVALLVGLGVMLIEMGRKPAPAPAAP
jgi:signal peptidase II